MVILHIFAILFAEDGRNAEPKNCLLLDIIHIHLISPEERTAMHLDLLGPAHFY